DSTVPALSESLRPSKTCPLSLLVVVRPSTSFEVWAAPARGAGQSWRRETLKTGKSVLRVLGLLMAVLVGTGTAASAQITTGTISGTVADSQGGVIPGATVILTSETRGTSSVPVYTSGTGDYTFPNVTPDRY